MPYRNGYNPPPNPWSVAGNGIQELGLRLAEISERNRLRQRQEEQDNLAREDRELRLHSAGYRNIAEGSPQAQDVGRDVLRTRGVQTPSWDPASLVKSAIPTHLGGYRDPVPETPSAGGARASTYTPGQVSGMGLPPIADRMPPVDPARSSRAEVGSVSRKPMGFGRALMGPIANTAGDDGFSAGMTLRPPMRPGDAGGLTGGGRPPYLGVGEHLRGLDMKAATAAPARYEHVTGDWWQDRTQTPEARARQATAEEAAQVASRLREALQRLGVRNADTVAPLAAEDPVLARQLVTGALTPAEAPTIRLGGREFPDTEEGRAAALAWDRQTHPSKYREPQGGATTLDPQGRTRGERSDLRGLALTRIENMLESGAPREQVAEVMTKNFGDLAGVWSADDLTEIETKVRDSRRRSPETQAIVRQLGTQPATDLDWDIVEALREGESPDEILAGMAEAGVPAPTIEQADRFLRRWRIR